MFLLFVSAGEPERDATDAPTRPDTMEDQPKDKMNEPPAVSPKLMPKVALRPKTQVNMFGADVMQQMQQRKNLRPSNNEVRLYSLCLHFNVISFGN